MNLDHDFVQVSKLNEDQKKKKIFIEWNTFFPKFREGQKKNKGLHQKWNTFFPEIKWTPMLRCTPESNYWEDADVDQTPLIVSSINLA